MATVEELVARSRAAQKQFEFATQEQADAAAKARKAAEDAKAGAAIPETFKDYLDKWVYSVKDNDELLDKIGGSRLVNLKNEPHLGYSTRH